MATSDASIKITADASGVVKGVAVAQGALGKLGAQMGELETLSAKGFSFAGLAGIGLSATAAAAALFGAIKSAADYGDQLDNMSQRTGIAVEELARLSFAAQMSDTSQEALGKGVTKLSGLMVAAAGGAKESSALFEKYGIAVRNTDGSIRSTTDVLGDLADIFSTLPDGAEKTALATEFFGKKMGVELIPLLNQGKAGLKAMGDEAERLGLVMSGDQAKAAAEFNDNLDRLASLSASAAKSIGNALIPTINTFLQKLMLARDNGLSVGQILFDVLPKQEGSIDAQIAKVTAGLAKIKAARDAAMAQNKADGGQTDTSDLDAQVARQEKMLAYLHAQRKKSAIEEEGDTTKRALMATQLTSKLQELERLRAIAAGQASADILKSDKDLNAARLKDAQALAAAIKSAYDATIRDAKTAADAAESLFDKARQKRNSTADKAVDRSTDGMLDEDKAAASALQAQNLYDQGRYAAAQAGAARLDGRLEQMADYQKKAEEYLSRAESFAEKSGDSGVASEIAEVQAQMLEERARAKQQEAAELQQRAADQMATLNQIEEKIKEITAAAANFEIKADVTQLESEIARIRAEIAKGAVMPIITAGGTAKPDAGGSDAGGADAGGSDAGGSFEVGGFTGWTGRKSVAGVVHGMEYVTPANVTLQPGVLPFLEALRKHGNRILPGYEKGGLVTALPKQSRPPESSGSRSTINLSLDGNSFRMSAREDVAAALTEAIRREALKKGGR